MTPHQPGNMIRFEAGILAVADDEYGYVCASERVLKRNDLWSKTGHMRVSHRHRQTAIGQA